VLAAECGKGTYVRALARDIGRVLGCHGHVSALRRAGVGPFQESDGVALETLRAADPTADGGDPARLASLLRPVAAGLQAVPSVSVSRADAARLARGQAVLLRGRDAPIMQGLVAVSTQSDLIALAEVEQGELRPRRIFNLGPAQASP
jgi:tRNA pseudouridine55 synthase